MNFFTKKNRTYVSLEPRDLQQSADKLWSELQYTLRGAQIDHVTIRLSDCPDISLRALSVIASLGLKLKQDSIHFELESQPRIINLIKKLNFSVSFAQLTEVA